MTIRVPEKSESTRDSRVWLGEFESESKNFSAESKPSRKFVIFWPKLSIDSEIKKFRLYGIAKNRVVPPVFADQYCRRYLATCLNIKFLWIFKESANEPHVLREFLNFQLASQLQLASWYGLASSDRLTSSTRELVGLASRVRVESESRIFDFSWTLQCRFSLNSCHQDHKNL